MLKTILIATVAVASLIACRASAETRYDALSAVRVPADAVEFMNRVDAVTLHVCGADTRTLYFRACSDDVNAFLKASVSVKARRSFRAQRAARPGMFTPASLRLF